MWHYEYTVLGAPQRVAADSLEACLDGLLEVRATQPMLTDAAIYEGGTMELGSGTKQFDPAAPST